MSLSDLLVSVVGLTGVIAVAWATWRSPEWSVALVVATVPLQAFARVGSDQTGVTWTQAWTWTFLVVGALLFASGVLLLRVDPMTVLFTVVVVCYIVSRHAAGNEGTWRNEVYRWSIALAFFVVSRALLPGRWAVWPLVAAVSVGAVWTGAVATVQVLTDSGPESFQRGGLPRAYASFGDPNTYGAFAAGCLVALASSLMFDRSAIGRLASAVVAAGCLFATVGLVLSQSRGALAATVVVVGTMALLKINALARIPRAARVSAAAAIVVMSLLAGPKVAGRVAPADAPIETTTASWADQERGAHWLTATRMVVQSSSLGVGAGQFDDRYRELTPAWRFRIPQGHAHNAYLQVAAETGVVGASTYVALLVAATATFRRRQRSCASTGTAAVALAATGVFALHNLVDYLHVLNLPIILMAWWASALATGDRTTTPS